MPHEHLRIWVVVVVQLGNLYEVLGVRIGLHRVRVEYAVVEHHYLVPDLYLRLFKDVYHVPYHHILLREVGHRAFHPLHQVIHHVLHVPPRHGLVYLSREAVESSVEP